MVKGPEDNFYQQLAVSAFGGAANAPDGYTTQTSTYDIKTNHVTLDELSEYRTRTTAAQYDKIRKALRDMAVTFNAVSYTHLDVYKRQPMKCIRKLQMRFHG